MAVSFIAQIDFAEIKAAYGLEGLPSSGRLLLFCDPVDYPWGMSRKDQTRSSVMFITAHHGCLVQRAPPAEFGDPQHRLLNPTDFVFRPRRLSPKPWLLPPPACSCELLRIDDRVPANERSGRGYPKHWGEATKDAYEQFWCDLAAKNPSSFGSYWPSTGGVIHQVGGIPFSIETDCVKFADDDYNSQPQVKTWLERARKDGPPVHWPDFEERHRAFTSFEKQQRAAHLDRANRWQLVLQIDSDFEAGMQWSDAGRVYVCIRKDDLAACRFERCWTILQCS